MNGALKIRPAPGTRTLNGIDWKPYVYRGTGQDTLTPFLGDAFDTPLPPPGRAGRPRTAEHGSPGGAKRHQRDKTPMCEACRQYESQRYLSKRKRAVHVPHYGIPMCGAWNIAGPLFAAPGDPVTCKRCRALTGKDTA